MADILNRLLLETKDFDAKLSNSKRGVNDYQSKVTDMAKTAGAGVLKFAGAIGLAYGGLETFNKVIHSSQGLGDSFDNTINGCKGTVDIFFQSLSTGDFSVFQNGILSTIKDMERLSALKDSLSDAKLSMGYNTKVFDAKFTEYESIIRDTTKSKEERNAALRALKQLKDGFKTDINDTLSGSIETLVKEFNAKSGRQDFTVADIEKYISINNNDFSTRNEKKALVEYQTKLKELQKQQYAYQVVGGGVMAGGSTRTENKAITKQIEELKEANKELEKQNWLNNDNDVSRKEMIQNLEYIQDLKKRGYDFDKRTLELQNSLASNGGGNKTPPPVVGSISEIDAELSKLNKELIGATTMQARIAVQTTINELEVKKINLQIETSKGVFAAEHGANKFDVSNIKNDFSQYTDIDKQISVKRKELIAATTEDARNAVQTTIDELKARKIELSANIDIKSNMSSEIAGVINSDTKNKDEKVVTKGAKGFDPNSVKKIKSPVSKKDVDLLGKYQEGLFGISDTMYLMSGIMNESAASWLNWGSSLLSSVAQGIPAIKDLILALQAKAAGEAIAGAAATGPLGWITAGAAMASIIATFASIPAFAGGGIYTEGSTFGDLNLARVNAGEMILNPLQQGNLFRLLNSGSELPAGSSRVVFKIHGRDLEGVLSNYTNQKIKVR